MDKTFITLKKNLNVNEHWIKNLSERIDVDSSVLREEISKIKKSVQRTSANPVRGQAPVVPAKSINLADKNQGYHLRVENLWSLFIKFPKLIQAHASYLKKEYFEDTPFAALYEKAIEQYNNNNLNIEELRRQLPTAEGQSAVDILLLKADKDFAEFGEEDSSVEIAGLLMKIKEEWIKQKRKDLAMKLITAQAAGDKEMAAKILQEIVNLND